MVISFIGGGNQSTKRKSPTCRKSDKPFHIMFNCIQYTSPWTGFELTKFYSGDKHFFHENVLTDNSRIWHTYQKVIHENRLPSGHPSIMWHTCRYQTMKMGYLGSTLAYVGIGYGNVIHENRPSYISPAWDKLVRWPKYMINTKMTWKYLFHHYLLFLFIIENAQKFGMFQQILVCFYTKIKQNAKICQKYL